ncbi:class I SAM-dependent methyltransferase [uncultured Gimesia sp.]|mgnify:FL=1|uniref:class I SAM-dependent methyltransferase n=1 Tax=uncultured Gimesia sp. TaxID=1678688 RepID=UPI0026244627|nr:class I SAM-dependent methyltransferase [uncultured Gimesia sp.]
METIKGHLYDYPKYYDLIFGDDWKAEYDFLQNCFEIHASRKVTSVFEPACGTGRLLIKLAQAGYKVAGNDLNEHAIKYCNDRLERSGFPRSAVLGDMSDFKLKKPVDAAFNTINSFRHLPTETAAENHLKCVAAALAPGGLYILGLHLTPTDCEPMQSESWSARRGNLSINSHMQSIWTDLDKRNEHLEMTFDVYTPTRQFQLFDTMDYRTYTAPQFEALLATVPDLELVELYDFMYEMDFTIELDAKTEDVVFILRKK